jgi:tripartite-type tricarboxylate transporter receptor subunit TctC
MRPLLACFTLLICICGDVAAQDAYPSKPIRFVVAFPQGGRTGSRRGGWFGGGDGARPPGLWHRVLRWMAIALVAGVSINATPVVAQNYPTKPIRFVVAFPPGGGTDILARTIGQKLGERFGQQVIIDNRGGAGGNIGTDIVAKAIPDGYTILMGSVGPLSINASLMGKLPFDPIKDLAPVTLCDATPNVLVLNPAVAANSVKELIALAKSRPGQLIFASSGLGTPAHLAGELFDTLAGVKMVHVPYKGGVVALTDLMAGQVQLMFSTMPPALPHIKAGKLKALAVTSARRSPAAPELPTIAEAALPGFEATTWHGVVVPARTPAAIIAKLNAEIVKILHSRDVRERLSSQGAEPVGDTPEEFAAYIRAETVKWAKVVKESGARAD